MRGIVAATAVVVLLVFGAGCGSGPDEAESDPHVQALMLAAYEGKADAVTGLMGQGVDVNSTDERGGTALMQAATWGRTEVVEVLLEAGAEIDA